MTLHRKDSLLSSVDGERLYALLFMAMLMAALCLMMS